MPNPLRILVVQGHRNTSGGNPEEAKRTPAIANAIVAALRRKGHDAMCLQQNDGTTDNWFAGSLDAVARRVVWHHNQSPIDLMLDVHLESDPSNTPGVFAIVPDGDGLRTLTHYQGSDSVAANGRDLEFARALARGISGTTGLALRRRTAIEPGVMSERQTHVGADLGWRLAMFGYTAPVRERMVRLVLECGNIGADRQIIDWADFAQLVARGVVSGIAEVLGGQILPGNPDEAFPPFGTTGDLVSPRQVNVIVSRLQARVYAETSQPVTMTLAEGSILPVRAWIIGESIEGNPVWWIVGDGKHPHGPWRVWSGGTDVRGRDVLALTAG